MHAVRRQARRHAWYADAENTTNLNPFGKHGIRHIITNSSSDLESGLSRPINERATSESNYRTQAEERRQSAFGRAGRTFSDQPPTAASGAQYGVGSPLATVPQSASSTSPRSADFPRIDSDKENQSPNGTHEDMSSSVETKVTDSQMPSKLEQMPTNSIEQEEEEDKSKEGPRRRRFGGFLGRHKNQKDDPNGSDSTTLEPTQTGASEKKRKEPHFTLMSQFQNTILNSPINILLVAVPVGIALHFTNVPDGAKFAVNFIAIIPLAAMLSYATEEIALRTGETLGGLLNASFGNATELIVSIIALFHNEIIITQTSLIGSMLSNLLLVLGMCFFFGGLNRTRQYFNPLVAQTASSLLALALAGLIVPTVFDVQTVNGSTTTIDIAAISRGVSVLLLLVYIAYLYFQLHTHADIFNTPSEKVPKKNVAKGEASKGIASVGNLFGGMGGNDVQNNLMQKDDEDEPEEPKLHIVTAVITLAVATAFIALNSEFMVDAIDGLSKTISKTFIGLILIPIVGNAAEHATAVTVACKDKMDLAIGVAVGSSMQIALLVLPLVVIIGWIAGKESMTLDFDTFQVVILFISILLVNYLIQDGESHWLEGMQLMILYIIIALASWYYPQPCDSTAEFCPPGGSSA